MLIPTVPKDLKESSTTTMIEWAIIQVHISGFKSMARTTVTIADKLTLKIMMMFDRILKRSDMPFFLHMPQNKLQYYKSYTLSHTQVPIEDKQMRIREHSDYGTITLLWQINDVPGLEVQDLSGTWHPVPYAKDGVVCNIGDLLQRWTNDYFKSTKHRVVNSHIDQERWSMPTFGTYGNNSTKSHRSTCLSMSPIESLEYPNWRLAQSY